MRHVDDGAPFDVAGAERWIERSQANVGRFGYGTGAVIGLAEQRLLGWAGFARPDGQAEEIIYGFEKAAWGQGYASELVQGLMRFGFGDLRLPELRATVHPNNHASKNVLLKAGFKASPWGEDVLFRCRRPPGFRASALSARRSP
jgi:RimJ/RimL family protein N-acetyltransferase